MNIPDELKKLDGENEREYIWRVGKLVDNGLLSSWTEITPYINQVWRDDEEDYRGESAYRKWYSYAKGFYEDVFMKELESGEDAHIKELKRQQDQIRAERYKLQATKLESDRYLRQNSRFELFYDNVKESMTRLPLPRFSGPQSFDSCKEQWVLGMGDIHYGAKFKSLKNEYSRDECKRRLEKLCGILKRRVNEENIHKLKIINVADTIQGILRMTDLQINDIPVVDSVVEISRLLALFLNELSSVCAIEYYHASSANHSQIRPLGSKASELASEDLERIIVRYVSDLLDKNDRVSVISDLDSEYLKFKIFDFNCVVFHGHQIKTVSDLPKDLSNLHRTFYDYTFVGHRHSANEIIVAEGEHHNIEILTCPCLIGSDPYSDKLMVGTKAMAKLYAFHPVNGHVKSENIILN